MVRPEDVETCAKSELEPQSHYEGKTDSPLWTSSKTLSVGVSERRGGNTSTYHLTAAVLAQSVERVIAEREVADSIPGARPILRVLK